MLGGVGAFLVLSRVVVREGYQTRGCWSRNLQTVRECGGKNIPGKCKGPEVEIRLPCFPNDGKQVWPEQNGQEEWQDGVRSYSEGTHNLDGSEGRGGWVPAYFKRVAQRIAHDFLSTGLGEPLGELIWGSEVTEAHGDPTSRHLLFQPPSAAPAMTLGSLTEAAV